MTVIDLAPAAGGGEVFNLSGMERGRAFRQLVRLDELDMTDEEVTVKIPPSIYAVTDSYVLGLFSPSVKRLGSLDAFRRKYRFEASPDQMKQIFRALERSPSRVDDSGLLPS